MRIAITGALGYVGPSVIEHLRASHPDAFLLGIDTGYFAAQHEGPAPAPEVYLDAVIYGDVRDLPADLVGVTHVVHLAAISNDPMGDRFESLTDEINHRQSVRLAQIARDLGAVGFIFASSGSVYGAGDDAPRSETGRLAPQTAYARSKIAAEEALIPLATDSFSVTCLRFATACGWSPRLRLDLVLNDFVASALTTGTIEVLSDGSPWRPLIHVRDMARAIGWAVSDSRADHHPGVITNVGCESWNFRIRDLAYGVAEVLRGIDVSINPQAAPDRRSYRLDFDRWRTLAPDHQPQQTLRSAIEELRSGLAGVPDLDRNFRQSPRMRLHRLAELTASGYLDASLRWTDVAAH